MSLATPESPHSLPVLGGTTLTPKSVILGKLSLCLNLTHTESESTHVLAPLYLACV